MAVIVKHYNKTGQATQKQIQTVIQQRQLLAVMDYVLQNTYKITANNDPRYKTLLLKKQELTQGHLLRQAKEIAATVGKTLDIKDKKGSPASHKKGEQIKFPAGKYYIQNQPYTLKLAEQSYQITIKPGNVLPALTQISSKNLKKYLNRLGLTKTNATQLSDVITDWQDSDQVSKEHGAESMTIKHQLPSSPSNKPLQSWQELYAVKGVDAAVIKKLQQHFALSSHQKKINKDYANPSTIAMLADVPETSVQQWLNNSQEKSVLFNMHKQAIDKVAGQEIDLMTWQITITDANQSLRLWFNHQKKTIQNWQFIPPP